MNSEIILCSGIKLDRNYENVLSYNENSMLSLCRNNAIYTGNKYKIVGVRENKVNVSAKYSECIYANYMAFINPSYGNKWFFAWVTDVKLLNPDTTEITFVVDVFSTWYDRFNIGQAYIEREHVSDDTFGKHTLPENLETGEYTIKSETDASDLTEVCPVVCSVYAPDADPNDPSNGRTYGSYCGNRFEALGYYIFKYSTDNAYDPGSQVSCIQEYMDIINNQFSDDGIVSIFMAPRKMVGWINQADTSGWTNYSGVSYYYKNALDVFDHTNPVYIDYDKPYKFSDLEVTRPTTFGTYTPVNNKCYCYPFQYINLTNNNGGNAIYEYEEFSTNKPKFEISGILTPSCSIRAVPKNYKGQTLSYNDGINGAKYPICSWVNDLFTNYMTQQGVNIQLDIAKDLLAIGGGVAATVATGGVGAVVGAGAAVSGLIGIQKTMDQVRQHSLIPPQARGNINGADIGACYSKLTFTAQLIQVKEEYIKCIDGYFSRFGYKVNEVKTPNLNSRTKFNFIKVGGMDELVSGNIPSSALEEINSIFRKGVTIFHNYNDIGNYTISNPIVS